MKEKRTFQRVPEDIPVVREQPDFTPEQQQAIEALRTNVFEQSKRAGLQFDALGITTSSYPEAPIGSVFVPAKGTLFLGNIATVLGAVKQDVPLDGPIAHEAGHKWYNNFLAHGKLEAIHKILYSLYRLHEKLASSSEALERITETFGSVDNFRQALARFEDGLKPLRTACKQSEFFSLSAEQLAESMERDDPVYRSLKDLLKTLPGIKGLKKFQDRLLAVRSGLDSATNSTPESSARPPSGDYIQDADFLHLLGLSSNPEQGLKIQRFAQAFKRAEEYAVDSFAQKQIDHPADMARGLKYLVEVLAEKQGVSFETYCAKTILSREDSAQEYPPYVMRKIRLDTIEKTGAPPSAEELTALGISLRRALLNQPPSQDISHRPDSSKTAEVAAPGKQRTGKNR